MDKTKSRSFLWMFPVVLVFAFAVLAVGVILVAKHNAEAGYLLLSAGSISVFAVLGMWSFALNLQAARQAELERIEELLAPVNERMQQINVLLNLVSEQQLISERTKAIAFRENERDTIRRAIREEIAKKDYEAALVLANDIERFFGYKQEADRFREEIEKLRQEEARKVITEAMAVIDRHCRTEQWSLALREADKLMSMYSWDGAVQNLPHEIENRRQAHKKRLLDAWNDAVGRHDTDGGFEILKQLDAYLTPAEANQMQETARQVLKDRLQLVGQQFTVAVKDHRWLEAIQLGEMLMSEYPNSRMAAEVKEKMELLRKRLVSPEEPAKV